MYKHIPVFVAALCAAVAMASDNTTTTTKAVAEPPNVAPKMASLSTFDALDKNGDGQISRTEAGMDKNLSNIFGLADTNGDGYVSKAEYLALPRG